MKHFLTLILIIPQLVNSQNYFQTCFGSLWYFDYPVDTISRYYIEIDTTQETIFGNLARR